MLVLANQIKQNQTKLQLLYSPCTGVKNFEIMNLVNICFCFFLQFMMEIKILTFEYFLEIIVTRIVVCNIHTTLAATIGASDVCT